MKKNQPLGKCGGLRELSDEELVARVEGYIAEGKTTQKAALQHFKVSRDRLCMAKGRLKRNA